MDLFETLGRRQWTTDYADDSLITTPLCMSHLYDRFPTKYRVYPVRPTVF